MLLISTWHPITKNKKYCLKCKWNENNTCVKLGGGGGGAGALCPLSSTARAGLWALMKRCSSSWFLHDTTDVPFTSTSLQIQTLPNY